MYGFLIYFQFVRHSGYFLIPFGFESYYEYRQFERLHSSITWWHLSISKGIIIRLPLHINIDLTADQTPPDCCMSSFQIVIFSVKDSLWGSTQMWAPSAQPKLVQAAKQDVWSTGKQQASTPGLPPSFNDSQNLNSGLPAR